jgi:hypothetical protein
MKRLVLAVDFFTEAITTGTEIYLLKTKYTICRGVAGSKTMYNQRTSARGLGAA